MPPSLSVRASTTKPWAKSAQKLTMNRFAMSAKNVFAERLKKMAKFSGGVMKPKNKGSFVRTVGPEPGCHFTGIQAAINGSLSGDTVAVVGSVSWDEHLIIQDKSINLIGGYNNCEDAINNPESNQFKVTGVGLW